MPVKNVTTTTMNRHATVRSFSSIYVGGFILKHARVLTDPFAGEAVGSNFRDGPWLHYVRQSLDSLGGGRCRLWVGTSRLSRLHVVTEDVAAPRADETVVAAPAVWMGGGGGGCAATTSRK